MRVFVTGGSGFVGSHFIRVAHAHGHVLRGTRRPGSSRLTYPTEPVDWVPRQLCEVTETDVAGSDAVVHFAAHTPNPPYDTFERCLHENAVVALRFLDVCRRAGVRRFVLAGSCFEYGRSAERYEFVPVEAPLEPIGSYAASKAAAAVAALAYTRHHGLELSLLRIFQVYGPGEPAGRLWPSLRAAAEAGRDFPMSAGDQIRDFIPVGDVAERFLTELDRSVAPGQPVVRNVGTGQPETILGFASHWWAQWGAKGQLRPGTVPYRPTDLKRCVARMEHAAGDR